MYETNSSLRVKATIVCMLAAMLCFNSVCSFGENKKEWQPGTVLQVKARQADSDSGKQAKQYDVSVKVGKKIYSAVYTPKKGEPELDYYVGMARMVLIEGETLKFNDLLGHTHSMRIVSSKDAPPAKSD